MNTIEAEVPGSEGERKNEGAAVRGGIPTLFVPVMSFC